MMMQRCQPLGSSHHQSLLARHIRNKQGCVTAAFKRSPNSNDSLAIHWIRSPLSSSTQRCFSTSSASEDSTTAKSYTTTEPSKKKKSPGAAVAAASLAARDVRLAGRRRFYRHVDVAPVSPPWSPEHHLYHKMSPTTVQSWLQPRLPGTTFDATTATTTNDTTSSSSSSWYNVTLDGKMVRTPMGQVLAVPSLSLAHCLAVEWDQQSSRIQPAQMPMMTLVCTALDQVVTTQGATFQQHSLNYLWTDTVCFYADPVEDRVLHQRQERAWKPIHAHVQDLWQASPATVVGTNQTLLATRKSKEEQQMIMRNGVNGHHHHHHRDEEKPKIAPPISLGLPHPPQLVEQAAAMCHSLDAWHLAALHSVAAEAKSFLVASYVIQQSLPLPTSPPEGVPAVEPSPADQTRPRRRSTRSKRSQQQPPVVQTAIDAARVEEEYQIDNWGLVEGGHDYDRLNCSIRIRAAQILVQSLALDHKW